MTYLLDVNVLIALAWPRHVHHVPATRWFADHHMETWATTPATESGFIRVSSNPRVFPDGATPAQAAQLLGQFRKVQGHVFWADNTDLPAQAQLLAGYVHRSASVTDAHLALLAKDHDATLTTFDSQAARLAKDLGAAALLLSALGLDLAH